MLPCEWEAPLEGEVFAADRLRVKGRIPANAGVERLELLVNGAPLVELALARGDATSRFDAEAPLDGAPARLALRLRGRLADGGEALSAERLAWRAGYRAARPGMPVVHVACEIDRSGGSFAARGRARLEGAAVCSLEFWRAGTRLAAATPDAQGAFEAGLDRADGVHVWLSTPGAPPISAGPAEAWTPRLGSGRLRLERGAERDYAEGRVELSLHGPDAPRATLCLDGRPPPAGITERREGDRRIFSGRIEDGPVLVAAEAFVDGALAARELLWNLDRAAFKQFRRSLRVRREVALSSGSGEAWDGVLPVQIADATDGWRFFVRRADRKEPEELREADVRSLDISETPFVYPPPLRRFRASFVGRAEATIEEPAWRRLGRPVALPAGRARPIALDAPRRIVLIRSQPFPTDEIYVLAPLEPLVAAGRVEIVTVDMDDEEIAGAPCDVDLRDGDVVVVVRYVTPRWLRRLTEARERVAVIYLMDDDVLAAIDTPGLPQHYRRRMIDVARWDFAAMLRLCDRLVVTSPHLAGRFASPMTVLLEPPWIRPGPGFDHHAAGRPIRIGCHATNVHRDDLEMIAPALIRTLEAHPRAELELISSDAGIARFAGRAGVSVVKPMDWPDYKAYARENPCHVTLAPMIDTPFNAGKSVVKFCDAASSGAVGLYSDLAPYRGFVEDGVDGFLVENDPAHWERTLNRLLDAPELIAETARACRDQAARKRSIEAATAFWSDLLFGGEPDPRPGAALAKSRRLD